jgi:hypothetical protein
MSRKAQLRVCASCEWIFKGFDRECPQCGFAHYGAHRVYGNKAYRYAESQEPWVERKLSEYVDQLRKEIRNEQSRPVL